MMNISQVVSCFLSFEHLLCVLEIIYVVSTIYVISTIFWCSGHPAICYYQYSGFGIDCCVPLSRIDNF